MEINEALKYAKACDYGDGDVYVINAIKSLADEVNRLHAQPRPRSMESAPRDGAAILVRGSMGWEVTRWDADGWGCRACGGEYGVGQLEAVEWMPLPTTTGEQVGE